MDNLLLVSLGVVLDDNIMQTSQMSSMNVLSECRYERRVETSNND